MTDESGELMEPIEKVPLKGLGESKLDRLVHGWRREATSWFQRRWEAYWKERSVIVASLKANNLWLLCSNRQRSDNFQCIWNGQRAELSERTWDDGDCFECTQDSHCSQRREVTEWKRHRYVPVITATAHCSRQACHRCTAVLFFSRPRSEGWPHHGRTFSIYLCPLSFWLTFPRTVLSTSWCCPSRPCVAFLVHCTLVQQYTGINY